MNLTSLAIIIEIIIFLTFLPFLMITSKIYIDYRVPYGISIIIYIAFIVLVVLALYKFNNNWGLIKKSEKDDFWKKKPVQGKNESFQDYLARVRAWQDAKDTMNWFFWKY